MPSASTGGIGRTPHAKVWRIALGLFMSLMLGYLLIFMIAPGYGRRSYTIVPQPVLAMIYLWHLLVMPATALVALLAKQGGHFDRAALTNPSGFAGVDGIFRLTQQGTVDRGLAVLEVNSGGSRVIDSAPATFAGAGF